MVTLKELYTTLRLLRDMNLHVDDKLLKAADDIEKDNQRGYFNVSMYLFGVTYR